MSTDDRTWINQQLMYYKDTIYSNSSFELSLSTSTKDFKSFSPLSLNLSITTQSNRGVCTISYPNGIDLINSFKEVMSNLDLVYDTNRNNQIVKKYQHDRNLKLDFKKDRNDERVISISVVFTNSDHCNVIIPYYVFYSFFGILKSFTSDFTKLNFDLINRTMLCEIFDQSKLIKNSIQVLPTSINLMPYSSQICLFIQDCIFCIPEKLITSMW